MNPAKTLSPAPAPGGADRGPRVLIVDDSDAITDLVSTALRYVGFDVAVATNARQALAAKADFDPALIVLDVMLPDLDGFGVARRLRDGGDRVPVIFLTARDATEDKISGLTVGGDDYVTKPFSLDELVARVHAVLRRTAGDREPGTATLRFADLSLDEDTHEVWRAGASLSLTATEFKLLRYLLRNARRVLSKDQILDHVWAYDFGGGGNLVETYISYLRKKVDRFEPPLIHTVRGAGYTLRLPPD